MAWKLKSQKLQTDAFFVVLQMYVNPNGGHTYVNTKKHCPLCPYYPYDEGDLIPDPFNIPPRDGHHEVTKQQLHKDARRDAQLVR